MPEMNTVFERDAWMSASVLCTPRRIA